MIRFSSSCREDIIWGRKRAVWCLPHSAIARWLGPGELHSVFVGAERIGSVKIDQIKVKLLDQWEIEELRKGPYGSKEELKNFLSRRFKTFNPENPVVGIFFHLVTLSI